MSEYWVSRKKYFCKYCEIYIADDAPSRQQHENGLKHKGNVERFIRGLYKGSERRKKDQDEEKREMARVEKAAQAAYHQDVAAGLAKPRAESVPSSSSAASQKSPSKPSNPYANYSTAASLGYTDTDAEHFAAETERRRTQGVAGDWEVVTTIVPAAQETSDQPDDVDDEKPIKVEVEGTSHTAAKREAEAPPDDDDARRFKLRKKTWGTGCGEVYDPTVIPIKLKKKEEPLETAAAPEDAVSAAPAASAVSALTATDAPKWKKVQWKRPGEDVKESPQDSQAVPAMNNGQPTDTDKKPVKVEDPLPSVHSLGGPIIKAEHAAPLEEQKPVPSKDEDFPPLTGMFRKRKMVPRRGAN